MSGWFISPQIFSDRVLNNSLRINTDYSLLFILSGAMDPAYIHVYVHETLRYALSDKCSITRPLQVLPPSPCRPSRILPLPSGSRGW